jgi:hypothetical protein
MMQQPSWQGSIGRRLACALAVSAAACGGGAPPADTATAGSRGVDPVTAGHITGSVTLEGTAPANQPIRMNADPVCVREVKAAPQQETFVVGAGGALANVFVYVKDGLGEYVFEAPAGAATLDQKGCRYVPHVFGIRVGQPLEIVNSDPTLHNIHAQPRSNREFNTGQPIQGMKTTHTFGAREVMVPFKCDVHGWMNAYAGVLDHPYFAVTDARGQFELNGLPPGSYTVEAWHERLGRATESVTLGANETKAVSFAFEIDG